MTAINIAAVSYDYDGAAAASGHGRSTIQRAVKSGDLPAHYVEVDGTQVTKPVILAKDLDAWVRSGKTERTPR